MSSDVFLTEQHQFKGDECLVTLRLTSAGSSDEITSGSFADSLLVEVESVSTCEQWSNEFNAKYLEDLTTKTGNYKPFMTFVHMFQSALLKKSSTVSLDLLTLTDLERLRRQKSGAGSASGTFASMSRSLHTSSKRYLILTYNVEFDRIHYPLVLQSRGQLDPIKLLTSLRGLQKEMAMSKQGRRHVRDSELNSLQKRFEELAEEKAEVEEQFSALQDRVRADDRRPDAKQTEVLKSVIRTLEGDMIKERTKHQRFVTQKRDTVRNMQDEIEELRAAEQSLSMRVKYLTNELASYKRNQSYGSYKPPGPRAGSTERHRGRSVSPKPRTSTTTAAISTKSTRTHGSPWQQSTPPSRRREEIKPSFSGSRKPRFDPTAYVKQKTERQQELAKHRGRSLSRSPSPATGRRSRSNSLDSLSGRPAHRDRSFGRAPAMQSSAYSYGSRPSGSRESSRNSSLERDAPRADRSKKATVKTPQSTRPPSGRRPAAGAPSGSRRSQPRQAWDVSPSPATKSQRKAAVPRALNASPDEDTLDYDEGRIADINTRLNHLRSFMQATFPEKHH